MITTMNRVSLTAALGLSLVAATAIADRANPDLQPTPSATPPSAAGAPATRSAPQAQGPRLVRVPQPTVASPSAQIGALGVKIAGAYACKGVTFNGDGSSAPMTAKVVIKLDLDNAWIQAQLIEDAPGTMKFTDYRTFDEVAKQWTRIQLLSTSGHVESTSLGEKDGKWTWTGTALSPTGSIQTRDYEQIVDPKQLKLWGEALLAGAWTKTYEVTCRK
jgi:hypothetical protein